jgi:hypothetical protein
MSAAQFLEEYRRQQESRQARGQSEPGAEAFKDSVKEPVVCGEGTGKPKAHQAIKLGIDVHLDRYVVVRQLDGGVPQPAQRFSPAQFLEWVQKQLAQADQVYSCYEA